MNRLCSLLCTLVLVGCGDDGAAPMATTAEPSTSSGSPGDNDGSSGPPEIRADLGVEPPEVCEAFCAIRVPEPWEGVRPTTPSSRSSRTRAIGIASPS